MSAPAGTGMVSPTKAEVVSGEGEPFILIPMLFHGGNAIPLYQLILTRLAQVALNSISAY